MRDSIVSILMSPDFSIASICFDSSAHVARRAPLSGYALASRLSYFLWASMPDKNCWRTPPPAICSKPSVLLAEDAAHAERRTSTRDGHRIRRQLARFPPF